MPDAKQGIRAVFRFYGLVSLGLGLVVLAGFGLLLALDAANVWRYWQKPLQAADWLIFGVGLLVLGAALGPYVATVGQLAGVLKMPTARIQSEPPPSPRRRVIIRIAVVAVGLAFAGLLLSSQSYIVWLTLGSLPVLAGLAFLYIAWRIGQIEKAARITIYWLDYQWHFDKNSFIGVIKNTRQP